MLPLTSSGFRDTWQRYVDGLLAAALLAFCVPEKCTALLKRRAPLDKMVRHTSYTSFLRTLRLSLQSLSPGTAEACELGTSRSAFSHFSVSVNGVCRLTSITKICSA